MEEEIKILLSMTQLRDVAGLIIQTEGKSMEEKRDSFKTRLYIIQGKLKNMLKTT